MNDNDWLGWRRGGIGASDIAAAVTGLYGGAARVIASKLGRIEDKAPTAAMERGNRWEHPIADIVHVATGLHVVGEQTWCQHADHDRHRATVDGFLAPHSEATIEDVVAVLEIKTTGRGRTPPWSYYDAQVQWQMHVTGIDRALVVSATIDDVDDKLIGVELRWIDRDDDQIGDLVHLAGTLLAHIDAGTLPEPTGADIDTLREFHRQVDPDADVVDLEDLTDVIARREELRRQSKLIEDEAGTIEAMILHRLGAATTGRAGAWRVKLSAPAMILTAAGEQRLLAERPDLGRLVVDRERAKKDGAYAAHTEPVGARRLTITNTTKGSKQ